jgi:hypothetical protein
MVLHALRCVVNKAVVDHLIGPTPLGIAVRSKPCSLAEELVDPIVVVVEVAQLSDDCGLAPLLADFCLAILGHLRTTFLASRGRASEHHLAARSSPKA